MELIVDWNAVCLVCLQEGKMRSIYDSDDKELTISDKIMRCSNIKIQKGMNLPEQICNSCYNDLKIAYRFRTNCENSNIVLNSFLNANTNANDNIDIKNSKGQVFKYKPPSGLNVKRIKIAPRFVIKDEEDEKYENNENNEIDEVPYKIETKSEESNEFNDDEYIVTINDVLVEEGNSTLEDDENINDEEHDISNSDYIEDEHVNLTDSETEYNEENSEMIVTKDDNNKKPLLKYKNLRKEKNTSKAIKKNTKTSTQTTSTTTTKLPTATTSTRKKRGRPRTKMVTNDNLKITPDNVSSMVVKLSSVAYVKKPKNEMKPLKICEICGNGYKFQHALDSHMRRHRNEKPFACEFCDRAFVANVELRRHMRVHTGQKPYACRYCPRRFSDFGSRIKHERTHTGERPYECSTCGKTFAYAHVLSVHLLTHTGEKKFKCEICSKGFTKKSYLQSHMNHHCFDISKKEYDHQEEQQQQQQIIHDIEILPGKSDEMIIEDVEHKVEYIQDE